MNDTHFKKNPSNDLPEYKSLTLTIGNSLIIKKTSGNDIASNHSSKKLKGKNATFKNCPLQSSTPMRNSLQKVTDIVSLEVKPSLQNSKSHQYGETGCYLIAIFGKQDFVLDFIKNGNILKD